MAATGTQGTAFDRARSAISAAVAAARVEPMTPGKATLAGEPATPGRANNRIESVLRLRPLGAAEASAMVNVGPRSIRMIAAPNADPTQASQTGQFHEFQFDGVLSGNASQEDSFKRACIQSGLIKTVMAGQNGILFAYGASGHGKTYTVTGTQQQPGLLPRMLQHIFNAATASAQAPRGLGDEPMKYMMWISFLEIYNEKIFDLLRVPTEDMPALKLQEDKKGHIFVKDLTEVRVNTMDEAKKCIHDAMKNRAVAETQLNHESSRSHTVFTLKLAQLPVSASLEDVRKNPDLMRFSKLSVIDLAGSERASKSGISTNEQFKEAGSINSSLLTLSRCIHAMRANQVALQKRAAAASTGEPTALKLKPVPFRDSKLTRLFQELFNGQQGKAVMIVNVHPRLDAFDEALQALKFASVAKTVTVGAASAAPTPAASAMKHREAVDNRSIAPIPFPSLAAAVNDKPIAAAPAKTASPPKPQTADSSKIDDDAMDIDTDALVDEVMRLREQVLESHRRCTEIEMEVRDEVSRELAAQMLELEHSLRAGFEKQIQLIEERYEKNWAFLNQQLEEERENAQRLEEQEAEWREQIQFWQDQLAEAQAQLQEKASVARAGPLSPVAAPSPAKPRKRKAAASEKESTSGAGPSASKKQKRAEAEDSNEEPSSAAGDMDAENEAPKNVKRTRGKAAKPVASPAGSPQKAPQRARRAKAGK
eukprot:TRINITY_DN3167_c0_g1_i1.p1 TRINITY_DN3167_c0_g1~~TRINITY_DN3167_c0_g1_i1.p1  ORF type:complete len:709 (+),score=175.13 TRINITY_DN3167_c0_g1_i1:102-2228(+)